MAKISINIDTKNMNKEQITSSLTKIVEDIDSKSYNFGEKNGDLKFIISKSINNLLPNIIREG